MKPKTNRQDIKSRHRRNNKAKRQMRDIWNYSDGFIEKAEKLQADQLRKLLEQEEKNE